MVVAAGVLSAIREAGGAKREGPDDCLSNRWSGTVVAGGSLCGPVPDPQRANYCTASSSCLCRIVVAA